MPYPDEEELLRKDLTEAITRLPIGQRMTVIEVGAEGITQSLVRVDRFGLPRGDRPRPAPWNALGRADLERMLEGTAGIPCFAVCTFPSGPHTGPAIEVIRDVLPAARVHTLGGALVGELLGAAISRTPTPLSYDLLCARVGTHDRRVRLVCRPLFPRGMEAPDEIAFTVRCGSTGPDDTCFAVVGWRDRRPNLLSVHTARLGPGEHRFRAELHGPADVRITDPVNLRPDGRNWTELVATIPETLDPPVARAHLICAIELTGTPLGVATRLDRAGQMISLMAAELPGQGRLTVGIVTYGDHQFGRGPAQDVTVPNWMSTPQQALESLGRLGSLPPLYPHAAQVEDMLAEVAGRLGDQAPPDARTVLLTIGDRPPHPAHSDRSTVLPCPSRHDWAVFADTLEGSLGVTFAAIRDHISGPGAAPWRRLGRVALQSLDAVDFQTLGTVTGLVVPRVRRLPVPLMETE